MTWLSELPPKRRPLLLVEDHLHHIGETLALLEQQGPDLLAQLTVVCLDRPGPDTNRSLESWLERYPAVHWAAPGTTVEDSRLDSLSSSAFQHQHELAKAIAQRIRPGGLLLQDVQLETLTFIPRDRWWESIYLAASVRGMFSDRPPCGRFLSNKKGYEATFGVDLLDAGFDPRDVIDKRLLPKLLIPTIQGAINRRFPCNVEIATGEHRLESIVGLEAADRGELEQDLDLVLWDLPGGPGLGGALIPHHTKKPRWVLKPESQELTTWQALIADLLADGPGVPVLDVGRRTAPDLAGRAEMTNCAARHIHLLRSRLKRAEAIQTIDHAYRLDRSLRIARCRHRSA